LWLRAPFFPRSS